MLGDLALHSCRVCYDGSHKEKAILYHSVPGAGEDPERRPGSAT